MPWSILYMKIMTSVDRTRITTPHTWANSNFSNLWCNPQINCYKLFVKLFMFDNYIRYHVDLIECTIIRLWNPQSMKEEGKCDIWRNRTHERKEWRSIEYEWWVNHATPTSKARGPKSVTHLKYTSMFHLCVIGYRSKSRIIKSCVWIFWTVCSKSVNYSRLNK